MSGMQFALDDQRPAAILRNIGNGMNAGEVSKLVGVDRSTVLRWKRGNPGFAAAFDRAAALSRDASPEGRETLDKLVAAWAPGGLDRAWPRHLAVAVDVIGSDGRTIASGDGASGDAAADPSAPYTTRRPPTRDEWLAEMARLSLCPNTPERVRAVCIAAVTSGLLGGPGDRSSRPKGLDDLDVTEAARAARGREAGVPASVWVEARRNFLGPAPGDESTPASEPIDGPQAGVGLAIV